MEKIQWKPVVFRSEVFHKYEVSSEGEIRRVGKTQPLIPFDDMRGYDRVDLMDDHNNKRMVKIHVAVAHTFLGPQLETMIINHKDGNKKNNHLSNLEYISQRENVAHAQVLIRQKTYLTDEQVREIHAKIQEGIPVSVLAKDIGIPHHIIRDVKRGKTYTHVQ